MPKRLFIDWTITVTWSILPSDKLFPSIARVKVQKSSFREEYLSFNLIQDARPPSNTTTSSPTSRSLWTQALSTSLCHENPKWEFLTSPLSTLNNICKTWKLTDNMSIYSKQHSVSPTANWRARLKNIIINVHHHLEHCLCHNYYFVYCNVVHHLFLSILSYHFPICFKTKYLAALASLPHKILLSPY